MAHQPDRSCALMVDGRTWTDEGGTSSELGPWSFDTQILDTMEHEQGRKDIEALHIVQDVPSRRPSVISYQVTLHVRTPGSVSKPFERSAELMIDDCRVGISTDLGRSLKLTITTVGSENDGYNIQITIFGIWEFEVMIYWIDGYERL
ncbi:hypothetical protein SCHPADRAFT_889474 [Schizopora paradoxa]|uniref:Uncharacterized protein n=1 Tax=Schizopora paradoxa TaxID=27342 RepID=A0A0H2RQG2_9AGAM|nr:hypothetical protein SCHPADRAFT_889474 [Schizopora paradoxa]